MPSIIRGFLDKFLSPNSKPELWLRTNYHRLNSTSLAFHIRDWHSRISCKSCFDREDNLSSTLLNPRAEQPTVSFILSLDGATPSDFDKTIRSIANLMGDHWEIICVGESTDFDRLVADPAKHRSRIKCLTTAEENLMDQISGDFILFCAPGDQFAKTLLLRLYEALDASDKADVYYYNCEYAISGKKHQKLFFKPEGVSPALLLSANYFSRGLISRKALEKVDFRFDFRKPLLAQEYRLGLKLQRESFVFQHLPYMLVSQNELVTSARPENQAVIIEHLERQGMSGVTAQRTPTGTRFIWATAEPSVAVIIPTLNNRRLLEPLVDSLLHNSYRNLSITIVDNNSTDPSAKSYLQEIGGSPRVSVIPYAKPFNYSEAINLGAANSQSDLLLFLNDDMGVINDYWLGELVQWATRPEIGVVGTKLVRANHTIQHAGIVLGLNGFVGHIYLNAPEDYVGLLGLVNWYRNYLAVTGACQMVRRDVFEAVGGYDEDYRLAFSDIDFCLKVHEKGYLNLYTPFASLYHYEGVSRGYSTPPEDILRAYQQMDGFLRAGDPYFSDGISFRPIPYCQPASREKTLKAFERRKSRYQH